jgi:predicted membrane-bound spermidine synthase
MALRAGIFLITFSALVFEIGITRIYSATIWYHFAFIAVSVALLGWGLGGLTLHLVGARGAPATRAGAAALGDDRAPRGHRRRLTASIDTAAVLALLYGLSIPLCLWMIVRFPFEQERLAIYFVAPVAPFLLAGMSLSMIFDLRRDEAGSLYFADLLGASAGALVVTLLLQTLGGEAAVLVAATAPLAAAACLSSRLRSVATVAAVLLATAAFSNERTGLLEVRPGTLKAMRRDMDEDRRRVLTQTGWNAYSRIDAVEGFTRPFLARLYIDSDAWTNVLEWDGRRRSLATWDQWYRALPFQLVEDPHTLVIGPGGGADVLVALASGSRTVTAVELNPLMIQFVRHYGARAGNLYDRPEIEVVLSEGRHFISRTRRQFDVILLGFVDSWASVASGGLSLSENYLYTTQAFRDYYEHLTDDGLLVIVRWDADIPRLVSNSVALLGAAGAAPRLAVVLEKTASSDPPQMAFLLRKRPFTAEETARIMGWARTTPIIVPGRVAAAPYGELLSGAITMAEYEARSPRRVGPVFDDSPFYFATERPLGIPGRMRQALGALVAPVVALLAAFVLFGKPPRQPRAPYAASIVYFASLGFGFIAVELSLLQNLTLLLGHPIFTLSVLLFTLLAAGGVGSALSGRVPVRWACLIVAILAALDAVALPILVPALLPLSLGARVAVAVALLAPIGLAMGMPFPQGLRRAGQGALPPPPFYWGLNGVMSVIGSVSTVVVAVNAGFQVAMLIGSACYVLAALSSRRALG